MSDSWFCWSFNAAQIPRAPERSAEIFFSSLMMFEAIFLVADKCTPIATKKEPNEPAETYGPNEDESLSCSHLA